MATIFNAKIHPQQRLFEPRYKLLVGAGAL